VIAFVIEMRDRRADSDRALFASPIWIGTRGDAIEFRVGQAERADDFGARLMGRIAVCCLRVTVLVETSVVVAFSATSSAVSVITPAPDVVKSRSRPSSPTRRSRSGSCAANVMSEFRLTVSLFASR